MIKTAKKLSKAELFPESMRRRVEKMREARKEIAGKATLQKPRVYGNKLNSAAAAEYLGVTEATLGVMRRHRMVTYIKYGKECRYLVADLEKCIQDHLVPAVETGPCGPEMLIS